MESPRVACSDALQSMKPEFDSTTPILRFVFAVAALSATLSVGGFVTSRRPNTLLTPTRSDP